MAKMTTQTPTENQNIDVQALMAQMEALQKQNADILEKLATSSENTFEKAKKKYEGPREYSYKIWDGKPVIDYVSKMKDSTKGPTYKTKDGVINNQVLVLTLADDSKVEVDVNDFNMYFKYSDKLKAEVINNGEAYKFNTPEHGEFTVQSKIIN